VTSVEATLDQKTPQATGVGVRGQRSGP